MKRHLVKEVHNQPRLNLFFHTLTLTGRIRTLNDGLSVGFTSKASKTPRRLTVVSWFHSRPETEREDSIHDLILGLMVTKIE